MSDENNKADNEVYDFETLLNSFINTKIEDLDDGEDGNSQSNNIQASDSAKENSSNENLLTEQGQKENNEASDLFEQELADTFAEARAVVEEEKNMPTLGSEESELAQAFVNYQASVQKLSQTFLKEDFNCTFRIDDLYPNYKPSTGSYISGDLVKGWMILSKIFPHEVGKFPVSSSDEEFLNFAETLSNQDLQLAVISYVEILIDMESCELTYRAKLAKYQEKHIKKILYEEYLARKERQRKFTEAVQKKNFPIDAERLISNYFRVAQKAYQWCFASVFYIFG